MKHFHCKLKHWLYDNHLFIALALVTGAFLLWWLIPGLNSKEFLGSAIASALGLSYFFLSNHLKEISLFKELFEKFNEAYGELDERLYTIRNEPDKTKGLSKEEVKTLYKYYNLCGEEYLYFKKCMIYPEVWDAWLNGMRIFHEDERIQEHWDDELNTCSYYGLTPEKLRKTKRKITCCA
jgi:hypothetical protein